MSVLRLKADMPRVPAFDLDDVAEQISVDVAGRKCGAAIFCKCCEVAGIVGSGPQSRRSLAIKARLPPFPSFPRAAVYA